MKKDFETRFMPMVKFKIPVDCVKLFDFGMKYPAYALTSGDGSRLSCVCTENERSFFTHSCNRLVSIYEAMPELTPDGMRYNKELDKLVPDVIQWQKVDNGANHIAADGTPFDTIEEALHHNCTLNLTVTSSTDVIKDFKPKKQSMTDWAKENINPNIVAFDDVEINKDEHPSKIKVESEKIVDITLEDKEILDELKKSGKSYLEIINVIKNTDTFKKHNGGDGNNYYDLPLNALQLQDLIEFKNMNANIKDIFKACWRKGDKKGVDEIYDVEKMVYYSLREAGKVLNTKDYISIATRIMGKQNVK